MLKYIPILTTLFIWSDLVSQVKLLDESYNSFYHSEGEHLWVSNQQGWNKYDGKNTNYYVNNDSLSGLKGTWVQSLLHTDANGVLWTSMHEYLCSYNGLQNRFSCSQPIVGLDSLTHHFKVIGVDNNANEVYYRGNNNIYKYSITTDKHYSISDSTTSGVRFYTTIEKGEINSFIGCPWLSNHIIEFWTKNVDSWNRKIVDFGLCDSKHKEIFTSQTYLYLDQLWLVTNIGLVKFNYEDHCNSEIFNPSNMNLHLNYMTEINDKLYITTQSNGLWIFDLKNQKYVSNINSESVIPLKGDNPAEIFEDSNSIYLSFIGNGIQIIPKYKLDNLILINNFNSREINLLEANDDYLVASENKKGIWILDNDYSIIDFIPIKESQLRDVNNSNDKVFYTDQYSLNQYTVYNKKYKVIESSDTLSKYKITNFKDNIAIIGNASLVVFNGDNTFKKIDFKDQLYDYYQHDSNHTLYATNSSTITTITYGDTIVQDIGEYIFSSSYSESTDKYYVGTSTGIQYLAASSNKWNKLKHWALENEKVIDLFVDSTDLYITTESNFYVLNANGAVHRLNLGAEKFDGIRRMVMMGNDIVWNEKGLLFAKDKSEIYYTDENDIHIEKTTYGINEGSQELLSIYKWDDAPPRFHFTYRNVYANENGVLRYKIDGLHNDYRTISITDSISVPHLSRGTHTLTVVGVNKDLTYSNTLKIQLNIKGPFWMQWWFFILVPLSIFGLVYWYFSTKTKRLMKLHYMREEINALEKSALQAQMNPHFIFNSLNAIQNFISMNEKDSAMNYLGKFAKLIRQYLNASVSNDISLSEEIAMLNTYCELESLRFSNRFDYDITCDVGIDEHMIRMPSMLIQPFVENAIIHGMKSNDNGIIKVHFITEGNVLIASIVDNGKGFDPNKVNIKKSLGMSITQKRLAYIKESAGDDYNVAIDTSNQGTSIIVHIPI